MNKPGKYQRISFLVYILTEFVCTCDSMNPEKPGPDYDIVVKTIAFHYSKRFLLFSTFMNIDLSTLLWQLMPHCIKGDFRFNPHKPSRGSVQQSLSEI
jgi:hypothetical protein